MHSETTKPSLLSRVRDGSDQASWREFEIRYRDLIVRYCRGRGLQHSDAEDVRQIVMMSLARSLRGFEYRPERGRFRDYLRRIVRNSISRYFARPNPTKRALDSSVLASVPEDDESETDAIWEREWVDHHYRMALQSVRGSCEPRSVEVFEHLLTGKGVDEVARAYAMTPAAVHKVKQRLRDRLQGLIARQIREEDQPYGETDA